MGRGELYGGDLPLNVYLRMKIRETTKEIESQCDMADKKEVSEMDFIFAMGRLYGRLYDLIESLSAIEMFE